MGALRGILRNDFPVALDDNRLAVGGVRGLHLKAQRSELVGGLVEREFNDARNGYGVRGDCNRRGRGRRWLRCRLLAAAAGQQKTGEHD
jgi:hypothetical protein